MADVKISQLPAATTPVDGTEVLPIVQSATTKQVSIANLTAGRAMAASSLTLTTPLAVTSGGTGLATVAQGALLSATAADTISATRTPTLGLAGTAAGTLGLSGSTSGVVTLQTAAAAGTWSMTLPTTGGTNGYTLTTNGSGVTSWTNPTALGVDLDVGTTAITGGTTGRVLYDNGGVLGEYSSLPVSFGGTGLTSLTAGYIPYGNGTGAFGSSANLFWDAANSRLGIGTANPTYKLDVSGGNLRVSSGAASAVFNLISTNGNAEIGSDASGIYIQAPTSLSTLFYTGGSERMRLDSAGNLGLGVTPSAWGANYKAMDYGSYASIVGNVGSAFAANNAYWNGAWAYKTSTAAIGAQLFGLNPNGSGGFAWFNAASGTAGQAISFTQAMTLDASGQLGVGISAPTNKLHVYETSTTCSVAAQTTTTSGNVARYLIVTPSSYYGLFCPDNANYLSFYDYNATAERMRIDSSGNLLVGTTSADGKLTVQGDASIKGTGNSGVKALNVVVPSGADREIVLAGVTGVSNGFQVRYISGAMQYVLTGLANGTLSTSSGIVTSSSDQNMKIYDGEVVSALDKVNALLPRYFYWKNADETPDVKRGRQLGFFAQEVNAVVPEASPTPEEGSSSGWGVYDRSIIAVLTKAIQELAAKVSALEAKQ